MQLKEPMQITNEMKSGKIALYRHFPIFNIPRIKYINKCNKSRYSFYKTKTGIVGNYRDIRVIEKNGQVDYFNINEIPPELRYPLYHTIGSGRKNAVLKLHENKGYKYYLRFLNKDSQVYSYILQHVETIPGYSLRGSLISNAGMTTNLHFDKRDGIQMSLYGKKRWYIFDPKDKEKLGITAGRRSMTIHGKFDESQIPKEVKYKVLETEPGDVVFIKSGDLHLVETLEDLTITIGFRKDATEKNRGN